MDGRKSEPPRFTEEEREDLFRKLLAVQTQVEELDERTVDLSAFNDLRDQILRMVTADAEQARLYGQLSSTVTALVQQMAAHAGGQVGGMVGAVTGLEAARGENKQSKASMAVLSMVLAAVTAITVELIRVAYTPPVPPQPLSRVEGIERELSELQKLIRERERDE